MALDSSAAKAQNTFLEIGTSAAGAETITVMTLSNPTILTAVAHGLSNGDIGVAANFAGADAALINGNTYVVHSVTDDTFAINIDLITGTPDVTDNTDAATFTPTTWTEVGSVVDCNKNDPGSNEIGTTHLRSTAKEFIFGLIDNGEYVMTVNYSFDDTAQVALREAQLASAVINVRATYPDGDTISFEAYVTTFNGPGAAVDGILTGDITLRITGDVTFA
jgi:hypothetical protein